MIFVANAAFCQKYFPLIKKLPAAKPFFSIYQPQIPPANFYCTQLGFFCKKELRFEAVTKVPLKFRLGSLQYNDWLEGKKNAGIFPYLDFNK